MFLNNGKLLKAIKNFNKGLQSSCWLLWARYILGPEFYETPNFTAFRKIIHCMYYMFSKLPRVSCSMPLTNGLLFLQQNIYICVRQINTTECLKSSFAAKLIHLKLFLKTSSFQSFWNFRNIDEKITTYNKIILLLIL